MTTQTWFTHISTGAKRACSAVAAVAALSLGATSALAAPFPNPAPGTLAEDIDGTGYFTVGGVGTATFELLDAFDSISTFGFYSAFDPFTLIPIFEAGDATGESALIDFAGGVVFDNEDAAIQSVFTPTTTIGFYLDLGLGGAPLFSDPAFNGGLDVVAAHQSLVDPFLNILFYDGPAIPGTTQQPSNLLAWYGLSDITPFEEVPVPATLLLMAAGLLGLTQARRKRA